MFAFKLSDEIEDGAPIFQTIYDANHNGIIDNSERLGGHLPDYFATAAELANYYTKTEIDELLNDIVAGELDLTNYYTKTQVDALIAGISADLAADTDFLTEIINNLDLFNNSEFTDDLTSFLNDFLSSYDFSSAIDLSNYYTKSEIDALLDGLEVIGGGTNLNGDVDGPSYATVLRKIQGIFMQNIPPPNGINDDFNNTVARQDALNDNNDNWSFFCQSDTPAAFFRTEGVGVDGKGKLTLELINASAFTKNYYMFSKQTFDFQQKLVNIWVNNIQDTNLVYLDFAVFPTVVSGVTRSNREAYNASIIDFAFGFHAAYNGVDSGSNEDKFDIRYRTNTAMDGIVSNNDEVDQVTNPKGSDLHIISLFAPTDVESDDLGVATVGGEHGGAGTIFSKNLTIQSLPDFQLGMVFTVKANSTVVLEIEYISSTILGDLPLTHKSLLGFNGLSGLLEFHTAAEWTAIDDI